MDTLHEVKIENLTDWLRSVRLNSGIVLHLPPRTTSQDLPKVEVQSNAEVTKLEERGAISVHQVSPQTTEDKPQAIVTSSSDVEAENLQKKDTIRKDVRKGKGLGNVVKK